MDGSGFARAQAVSFGSSDSFAWSQVEMDSFTVPERTYATISVVADFELDIDQAWYPGYSGGGYGMAELLIGVDSLPLDGGELKTRYGLIQRLEWSSGWGYEPTYGHSTYWIALEPDTLYWFYVQGQALAMASGMAVDAKVVYDVESLNVCWDSSGESAEWAGEFDVPLDEVEMPEIGLGVGLLCNPSPRAAADCPAKLGLSVE